MLTDIRALADYFLIALPNINTYILETLEGVEFPRALNGEYPKKYYPSIWVDA